MALETERQKLQRGLWKKNRLGMEAQNTMEKCNWSHYYGSAAVYSPLEGGKKRIISLLSTQL